MVRSNLISLFRSRGGGLYALGYVVSFVVLEVLEIPDLLTDLAGFFSGDGSFVSSLLALMVDFFVDTLRNVIYSFVWPGFFLQLTGPIGVAFLAVGFATYNRILRPIVERVVPELKAEPALDEDKDQDQKESSDTESDAKSATAEVPEDTGA